MNVIDPLSRVCIVTSEIEGPFFNGGVGSANLGLALALRQIGYSVDILYTQVAANVPVCLRGEFSGHVSAFAKQGIRLVALYNPASNDSWLEKSYQVMLHLLSRAYQTVFIDDLFGAGYYSLLARRTGSEELSSTTMIVTAHGALEWVSDLDESAILNLRTASLQEMERRSVELADVLRAPSAYILKKYESYGWGLPKEKVVQRNFVSNFREIKSASGLRRLPVNEIVFFGRLETRKGIWLFLRAIDRIKYQLNNCTVTFLGKSGTTREIIFRHTLGWPIKTKILTEYNQQQAISYLRSGNKLAVMPSPEDNSPGTVVECLDHGIPFITTNGSGAAELMDSVCHANNLCDPQVDALAGKILDAVKRGGCLADHAMGGAELLSVFSQFMEDTGAKEYTQKAKRLKPSQRLGVIVLTHALNRLESIVSYVKEVAQLLSGNTLFCIVTDRPQRVSSLLPGKNFRTFAPDCLGVAATTMAELKPEVVWLSNLSLVPSPIWFSRAQYCFERGMSAVSGMTRQSLLQSARPSLNELRVTEAQAVDRYILGNARALLTLEQSTNCGFVLLDPALLNAFRELDTYDMQHGRVRASSVIIHQLLARISLSGGSFELIPDLELNADNSDAAEIEWHESDATRLAAKIGLQPSSALWAVSRLAVDAGMDSSKRIASREFSKALSHRVGFDIDAINPQDSWSQQVPGLARLATAFGRSDVATALLTELLPDYSRAEVPDVKSYVVSEASAIHLLDVVRKGSFTPVNLVHDYSFDILNESEWQMHVNSTGEPRAMLLFPEIDLGEANAFLCGVSLPSDDSKPVRLKVDVFRISGSAQCSFERVLTPMQFDSLRFTLPLELQATCRVVIGLEMLDPMSEHAHAYVRFEHARFVKLSQ